MRVLPCLVLALASVSATAQRPGPQPAPPGPASSSGIRARETPVVIDGCVRGRRFQLAYKGLTQGVHEEVLRASEFVLEGPSELLKTLAADHDGHHEEITGIAILPPATEDAQVDTRTKEIGGVRVTAGVRQRGGRRLPKATRPADAPRPVRIRVQ